MLKRDDLKRSGLQYLKRIKTADWDKNTAEKTELKLIQEVQFQRRRPIVSFQDYQIHERTRPRVK